MNIAQLGIGFKMLGIDGLALRLHTEKPFITEEEFEDFSMMDCDSLVGVYRTDKTDIIVFYLIVNGENFRGFVTEQKVLDALKKQPLISGIYQKEFSFSKHGFKMQTKSFMQDLIDFEYNISQDVNKTAPMVLNYLAKVTDMSDEEELEFAKTTLLPEIQ